MEEVVGRRFGDYRIPTASRGLRKLQPGGLCCQRLTSVAGLVSHVFTEGLVTYSNEIKRRRLLPRRQET